MQTDERKNITYADASIQDTRGFVWYESDLTRVLWPSQPPGISVYWRFWSDVFRQTVIYFNEFVCKQKVKATGQ